MRNGKVTLKITNRLDTPRVVVLEPWAGEYTLHPGRTFEIVAEGDLECPLELEVIEERLVVYSFDSAGALLTIFRMARRFSGPNRRVPNPLDSIVKVPMESPAATAGLFLLCY